MLCEHTLNLALHLIPKSCEHHACNVMVGRAARSPHILVGILQQVSCPAETQPRTFSCGVVAPETRLGSIVAAYVGIECEEKTMCTRGYGIVNSSPSKGNFEPRSI